MFLAFVSSIEIGLSVDSIPHIMNEEGTETYRYTVSAKTAFPRVPFTLRVWSRQVWETWKVEVEHNLVLSVYKAQVRPPCSRECSPNAGLPVSGPSWMSPPLASPNWEPGMQFQGEAASSSMYCLTICWGTGAAEG